MTLKTNNAEGQANGTALTAGVSGGSSGDAFSSVNKTSGTAIFDNTQKMHGTLSHLFTPASGNSTWVNWNGLTATSCAARFYIRFATLPSLAGFRLLDIRDSAGTGIARIQLDATNHLQFVGVGGTLKTYTGALSANTWYRFESSATNGATTAVLKMDAYLGDSATPTETGFSATGQTGSANTIADVRFGESASSTFTGSYWMDDYALQDASAAYIGPKPPDVTPFSAEDVASLTSYTLTATIADGVAPDSWAFTQLSGTSVTMTGSGSSRTFTTPATVAGDTVTIGVTATRGGVTGTQQVKTLNVKPHQLWLKQSGAFVPVRGRVL